MDHQRRTRDQGVRAVSGKNELVRFGVSMSKHLLIAFDDIISRKGYATRSQAIRDVIRDYVVDREWEQGNAEVAGTITLIYDHHTRGLNDQLLDIQHDHHKVILSTMHVHIDKDNCLEVLVVKGKAPEISLITDQLICLRGVKHGKLTITSTETTLTD